MKKIILPLLLLCGPFNPISAQTETFDLSSQRGEVRDVNPVPGHKIDHGGIVINPTPQHLLISEKSGRMDLMKGFRINDKKKAFQHDVQFLQLHRDGVPVTIDYGVKLARRRGVKELSGAYSLQISAKGVEIVGWDERGAFYALQTLRQLLDSDIARATHQLPELSILDYPALPNRGVVEGFYGTPWSHEVRKSLIDFYGRNKLDTYLYGPKDDPYHSCPRWREAYPAQEANRINDLVEAAKRNRVDFVWAIHPGQDIKWNEEDYRNLVHKFNLMYDLGVRHFAVFFDDINGEGTNPVRQVELLNRLTKEFVKVKGDVSPLTVCPTDYSKLWANPTEQGSLAIYGRQLDPSIKVFWTGDVVCSDLTPATLNFINARIKRPAYYWWNYPVTDYARHILLQGPVYGLDTTVTAEQTCGLIANPMEHGEASKLALYGVADYAWNTAAYNPIDNWERGLQLLMPKAHEAYRTFAIHSADTENGYRRDESWETTTFTLDQYTKEKADKLYLDFKQLAEAPAQIKANGTNSALLSELTPWLDEAEKLGKRGMRAIQLLPLYSEEPTAASDSLFWKGYVENLMTIADEKAYDAHKVGTLKMQPFYKNLMDDMAHGFLQRVSGQVPTDYRPIGSFGSCATVLAQLMLDGDSTTYFTSGQAQRTNDWIGLDLRAVRSVSQIIVYQGRNAFDDCDYFDHAALQVSADGKTWETLLPNLRKQYDFTWQGAPIQARYVRLLRQDSERKNYASIREFQVNPLTPEGLGLGLQAVTLQKAVRAFDGNPLTRYHLNGKMSFSPKSGDNSFVFLMGTHEQPVIIRQLDKKGVETRRFSTHAAFLHMPLSSDAVSRIEVIGDVDIYEVVAK